MSTLPSSFQSSRSSTGTMSQQSTLVPNAASALSLSPAATSTSSSTPNSTPGSVAPTSTAYEEAVAKHYLRNGNPGNTIPAGNIPATGSTISSGGAPPTSSTVATTAATASITNSSSTVRIALKKFKARLSGTELVDFRNTKLVDLRKEMSRIQAEQDARREMMNMSRIQRCIEAMDQFGKVIEIFLNVSDAVAFIWGPMKFLLLVSDLINLQTAKADAWRPQVHLLNPLRLFWMLMSKLATRCPCYTTMRRCSTMTIT